MTTQRTISGATATGDETYRRDSDGQAITVWYDRSIRLWTAYAIQNGDKYDQAGPAVYGVLDDLPAMVRDVRLYEQDAPLRMCQNGHEHAPLTPGAIWRDCEICVIREDVIRIQWLGGQFICDICAVATRGKRHPADVNNAHFNAVWHATSNDDATTTPDDDIDREIALERSPLTTDATGQPYVTPANVDSALEFGRVAEGGAIYGWFGATGVEQAYGSLGVRSHFDPASTAGSPHYASDVDEAQRAFAALRWAAYGADRLEQGDIPTMLANRFFAWGDANTYRLHPDADWQAIYADQHPELGIVVADDDDPRI